MVPAEAEDRGETVQSALDLRAASKDDMVLHPPLLCRKRSYKETQAAMLLLRASQTQECESAQQDPSKTEPREAFAAAMVAEIPDSDPEAVCQLVAEPKKTSWEPRQHIADTENSCELSAQERQVKQRRGGAQRSTFAVPNQPFIEYKNGSRRHQDHNHQTRSRWSEEVLTLAVNSELISQRSQENFMAKKSPRQVQRVGPPAPAPPLKSFDAEAQLASAAPTQQIAEHLTSKFKPRS